MKKLNAFLILMMVVGTALNGALHAQSAEMNVNHELGLRLFGLNDFDFIYKKQKASEKYRRYRLGYTNFNYSKNGQQRNAIINIAFAFGYERRRQIAEKLKFINGWELLGDFGVSSIKNNDAHQEQVNLSPGIGIVLGFQYDISEKFRISLETIPSITASYSLVGGPNPDRFQVNGGFNTSAVALSMVYCFSNSQKNP